MYSLLKNIKKLLSYKGITILIILIAVVSRVIHLIFFFNIRVDRNYQLLATQNFITGKGITLAEVLPADLSNIIYTPLIKWPPGYSLLLSPFYTLFANNYLLSALFLDILFGIILIFVSRAILRLLQIPLYLINIYTLASSFFIYYFYFITSSDAIAATFFIIALYYTLLFLKAELNWLKAVLLITIFLFATAFIKYLFMPVVFFIPAYLVVKGLADKKTNLLKTGVVSFIVLLIALIILFVYQKNISGSSGYVSESARGFFPANLLSAYPLIPAAVINPDTVTLALNKPAVGSKVLIIYKWIYLLFIAFSMIYLSRLLYKYRLKKITLAGDFFYLLSGVCFITILLLAILSVWVAKGEDMPGNWWTFIQEPRYYSLPAVLIHISIFVFYLHYSIKKTRVLKYLFYFFLLLLLPEMFRGMVFTAKRIINLNREEYSWQSDLKFQKYAAAIIEKGQIKYSLQQAVVTGSSYYLNNRISLYSHIPILPQSNWVNNPGSLHTEKPVLLLIILHKNAEKGFHTFLSDKKIEVAGEIGDYLFYTVPLIPD